MKTDPNVEPTPGAFVFLSVLFLLFALACARTADIFWRWEWYISSVYFCILCLFSLVMGVVAIVKIFAEDK